MIDGRDYVVYHADFLTRTRTMRLRYVAVTDDTPVHGGRATAGYYGGATKYLWGYWDGKREIGGYSRTYLLCLATPLQKRLWPEPRG